MQIMSPTGSLLGISTSPLPGRLPDAGDLRRACELAEAQPADLEFPIIAPPAAADRAAIVRPRLELGLLLLLDLPPDTGHPRPRLLVLLFLLRAEGHPQVPEELKRVVLLPRLDPDGDVHPLDELHLIDVDLRKDDLLGDPHVVVSGLVERLRR